jgi:hypothetical protein
MTVMLTVMSGMDPHMISGTWVGLVLMGQSCWLGQSSVVDSMV